MITSFFPFPSLSGFIVGNKITSRIVSLPVKSITKRSIPIPIPPAGGIPYSKASTKSISISLASSLPSSLSFSWFSNLSYWSIGSLSSVNAFAYSLPIINNSNLWVNLGSFGSFLAKGLISIGWPKTKVGSIIVSSTNFSKKAFTICPKAKWLSNSTPFSKANFWASSSVFTKKKLIPVFSRIRSTICTLLNPGAKLIWWPKKSIS